MYFPLSFVLGIILPFRNLSSFFFLLSLAPLGTYLSITYWPLIMALWSIDHGLYFFLDSYLGNGLELTLSLILCSCFMLLLLSLPFQSSLRAILILSKSNILTVGYILRAFLSMPTYLFICKSVFYTYHNSLLRPLNPGASCMFLILRVFKDFSIPGSTGIAVAPLPVKLFLWPCHFNFLN